MARRRITAEGDQLNACVFLRVRVYVSVYIPFNCSTSTFPPLFPFLRSFSSNFRLILERRQASELNQPIVSVPPADFPSRVRDEVDWGKSIGPELIP